MKRDFFARRLLCKWDQSAEGFLREMDSGSKGQAWVENLCQRFSTFCSEADEIICQDSVKYVRTQLITAGENLIHLCSELVEDVLPDFSTDTEGENDLASPAQEQNMNFPAQKMLSIGVDLDQDRKLCTVDSASSLSSIEPVGERYIDIQSDGKDEVNTCFGKQTLDGDECNVHAYSLTSVQPPAAATSEKTGESKNSPVEFREYELPDDEVTCASSWSTKSIYSNVCTCEFSIIEFHQPSGCQKLEESIIMVNNDECYSDSGMETNYLPLENTTIKLCTLNEKTANERSSESVFQERDQMTEKCCKELPRAKDSRMVNEYFCDSDWEII